MRSDGWDCRQRKSVTVDTHGTDLYLGSSKRFDDPSVVAPGVGAFPHKERR